MDELYTKVPLGKGKHVLKPLPELKDQWVPFHLSMQHRGKSSMTYQQIPKIEMAILFVSEFSTVNYKWRRRREHTNFRPVKSAAAFTLPSRWIFEANWVVITLPLAAEICRIRESATTVSLSVLPGESTFVESLIIYKARHRVSGLHVVFFSELLFSFD